MSLAILPAFLVIFCQLHEHLSQNLGSNGHFEDPNLSKSQLNQKLRYKIQIFPIQFFFNFVRKKTESLRFINGSFMTISGHFSANCIKIFHKTEVQTIILRYLVSLNLNWISSNTILAKILIFSCLETHYFRAGLPK